MLSVIEVSEPRVEPNWDFLTPRTPEIVWFSLTPRSQAVELLLKNQYQQRYMFSTALTSRLQIQQLIK